MDFDVEAACASLTRNARLRQYDIDFQNFEIALFFQRHLDVVRIAQDLFGNDADQFLLQSRLEIGLGVLAPTLVRND